jgi:hypothetical protein
MHELPADWYRTGKAFWAHIFASMKPMLNWNDRWGFVAVTCEAPLKRRLRVARNGSIQFQDSYILVSSAIAAR